MKAVLFRVYLVLAVLAIAGVRLASPLWIADSPEVVQAKDEVYMADMERRLVYVAGGVADTTSMIQFAYYDPMVVYDETWLRLFIHTTLSTKQAEEYMELVVPPVARQTFHQEALTVALRCSEYGDYLIEALDYGYGQMDEFNASMDQAVEAYTDCVEQFGEFAEKYDLFKPMIEGDAA